MKRMKNTSRNNERGEVMLEGMIVMVITMFILIWLLGLSFLYYQRYVTTVVTNDAAVKIASTYGNPTSDIIMGFTSTEDIRNRELYRSNKDYGNLLETNQDRAKSYIKYILDTANFAGTVKNVEVELKLINDSRARRHVELTTTCEYNTPFGEIFEMFGMTRTTKYSVTATAEYTDILDYAASVNFKNYINSGDFLEGTGFAESLAEMLNTLIQTFNKFST